MLHPVRTRPAAQMGIGGKHVAVNDAIMFAVDTVPAQHPIGKFEVRRQILNTGIVKLVSTQ